VMWFARGGREATTRDKAALRLIADSDSAENAPSPRPAFALRAAAGQALSPSCPPKL